VSHPVAEERPVEHGDALNLLRADVAEAPGPQAAAQRVVEQLHERFPHYDWVGIYWVEGDELVLGPWVGPEATEHTRIPIGSGICGAAADSGQTQVVDDVDSDPRYLACFASTRSERSTSMATTRPPSETLTLASSRRSPPSWRRSGHARNRA
jgi:putative methionine-R-sulfoxide reductase with GAF domain